MSQHFITLDQAIEMTTRYRENRETILAPQYQGQDILPRCETFSRDAIDFVLQQPDCVGMRVYGGMDEQLKVKVIIVGVNSEDVDILPAAAASLSSSMSSGIVEDGIRCPTNCPPPSKLNP